MALIDKIHVSRTTEDYESAVTDLRNTADRTFFQYFKKSWLESQFNTWKLLDRPAIVPTTNSGLESINNQIKNYTDRNRMAIPMCLVKLQSIVESFGEQLKPFRTKVEPTVRMKKLGNQIYSASQLGYSRQIIRNGDM